MAYHVYDATYFKIMTIAMYDMQSEDTKAQCIIWKKLNKLMRKNGVEKPNFKASWWTVCKPTGMPSKSSMAMVTQRSPWKTKNTLASCNRLHCYNDTHRSTSNQTCKTNTIASISNIRIQRQWKRQNQDTLSFRPGSYL
jgi:hypothetical protein